MQNLDKPDLNGLEYQINSLLQTIQQLKVENNQLRHYLSQAQQELVKLEEKNQQAILKINDLIVRLKEERV
ncbi:MAG: hypothetical protein A3F10_03205 [Coxiella sp. RIFCSPHIGHO2_12_FULL_42_15]|nr:MAG: hypothetical protein A3F10_03205 [Coxiella sp. RIFCSPHIGHO2_12_FULL_42_15]